ncbi:MAG: penicillin-binding protein 2 [Alphaproteobacteria bacterium]
MPVSPEIEVGRNRLLITASLFAVAFSVVAVRLVDVGLLAGPHDPRIAETQNRATHQPGRADIVDRNGVLLAANLKIASLYANTRLIDEPDKAAARLRTVLPDEDPARLRKRLASGRAFIWLRRHLTPRQQYAVNRLGIPGLEFRTEETRLYPAGRLTAHVLGHTDIDNHGIAGTESHFEKSLRRDAAPLRLTLDLRVQHVLRTELWRAMVRFKAIGAAGVVMDVSNGEVLSLVSLPDFDPKDANVADEQARFNRATLGVYEMGSTFKIFTTAMALDSGKVTLRGGYDATKPIRVARFVIRDYHAKRRWLSVPEIFMYSSNIGAVKMALDVGIARQRTFMDRLGLLRPSPVELSEIGAPLVPAKWREVNAMTISFGHGLAISPVQLTAGVAAIINGGVLYPPTLRIRPAGEPLVGLRVISKRTSEQMRRLMRLVVKKGTGRKAAAKGYLVGGKTGTAEKVVGRRYRNKALMSSFVGAFPMTAPRYVVFAMLDEPTGTKQTNNFATGGWVAAPVVGAVISRIGPLLGVRPIDEEAPETKRRMAIDIVTAKTGKRRLASF